MEEALQLWSDKRGDPVIEALGGIEAVRALIEEGRQSEIAASYDIEDLIAEEHAALRNATAARR